jgi:3'(2'), 5'-bisphosphate nucleotidase
MEKINIKHDDLLILSEILIEAGNIVLSYYKNEHITSKNKDDYSPVTIADEKSNEFITKALLHKFPSIPVVSEENYSTNDTNLEYYWIIDPLDGTSEFLNQTGEFTINLGLIYNNEVVAGVLHQPVCNKTFLSLKSTGAFYLDDSGDLNIIPVKSDENKKVIVFYRSKANPLIAETAVVNYLQSKGYNIIEQPAGAAIKHINIAQCTNGMYLKLSSNHEWDTAPGQLLIEETGGKVIDLNTKERVKYGKKDFKNNPMVMLSSDFVLSPNEIFEVLESLVTLSTNE